MKERACFATSLAEALTSAGFLVMDGALGTELLRDRETTPSTTISPCVADNVYQPHRVQAIHEAYVAAGADILLTNTFQAHPSFLHNSGLPNPWEQFVTSAVRLARQAHQAAAFDRSVHVLASIGPLQGESAVEELIWLFKVLEDVDGYLFETWSDPKIFTLVESVGRSCTLDAPLLFSFTYEKRAGRLISQSGHTPEAFARWAERCSYKVTALGVNCGRNIGLPEIVEIVQRYRQITDLPLFARPNAGSPTRDAEGKWRYSLSPAELVEVVPQLLEEGVCMIGGCCGTRPEHVSALRQVSGR